MARNADVDRFQLALHDGQQRQVLLTLSQIGVAFVGVRIHLTQQPFL
jgi:hypothetical protein